MATRESDSDDPVIIQTSVQSDTGAAILYQLARLEKSIAGEIEYLEEGRLPGEGKRPLQQREGQQRCPHSGQTESPWTFETAATRYCVACLRG